MENTEDTIASNGSEPAESSSKAIESNVGDKGKKPIESKKSEKRGRGSHYPVRCCEPNCGFFVRSGYCRYGSACRFNHPRRRAGRSWTGSRSSQFRDENPANYDKMASSTILCQEVVDMEMPALKLAERFEPRQTPNEPLPSFDLFQSNTPSEFPLQINYNSGCPNPATANASSPSIQNAGNTQAPSMTSTNHTSNKQAYSEEVQEQLLRDPQIVDMIMVPTTPTGLPLRPERPVCFFYDAYGLCQNGPACHYDHPYPYNPSQHRVVATREDQINRRY